MYAKIEIQRQYAVIMRANPGYAVAAAATGTGARSIYAILLLLPLPLPLPPPLLPSIYCNGRVFKVCSKCNKKFLIRLFAR